MSLNTAGQKKCLFCRNSYLAIQALLWCQCKSRSITEEKEKRKSFKLLRSQYFSTEKERERARERERERERKREREREREIEREKEGEGEREDVRKSGRSHDQGTKLRGGRAQTSDPISTRRQTPCLNLFRTPTYSWKSEHWKNVINCFTKNCFCNLLMPCVVTSTAA